MAHRTQEVSSPRVDDAIFVSESDSSDSDANLAHAASAMRRTSQSHGNTSLAKSSISERAATGTNGLRNRSTIELGDSRSNAIPATVTRRESSYATVKQMKYNDSSYKNNQRQHDLTSRLDRSQPEQRKTETALERRERILHMRNERKRKESGRSSMDAFHKQDADQDTEMIDEDWFKPEDLGTTQQRHDVPHPSSHADSRQRLLEREAEAKRKQESRERAFRKAQRGRAIPVSRSYNAARRTSQPQPKRRVEKYEPPVDFGSTSESSSDEESDETEWDVEAIRGHAIIDGQLKYEVKWTGYDTDENTWEPEEYLQNASVILERYKENNMRIRTAPQAPMMG